MPLHPSDAWLTYINGSYHSLCSFRVSNTNNSRDAAAVEAERDQWIRVSGYIIRSDACVRCIADWLCPQKRGKNVRPWWKHHATSIRWWYYRLWTSPWLSVKCYLIPARVIGLLPNVTFQAMIEAVKPLLRAAVILRGVRTVAGYRPWIACPQALRLFWQQRTGENWSESRESPFVARPSFSARAAFPNEAESLGAG